METNNYGIESSDMPKSRAYQPNDLVQENYSDDSIYRSVCIEPLHVGFILRVGCQSIAVENKLDLIKYLTKYFENPKQAEVDYYSREIFKK